PMAAVSNPFETPDEFSYVVLIVQGKKLHVDKKEFVDLLKMIHPGFTRIRASTVSHIVKLSHQFQMKSILDHCQHYLLTESTINVVEKLILADTYNLQKLKNECFYSIDCIKKYGRRSVVPSTPLFLML
ncbi:hypothetical protein PMAYCL1PPCAC_25996, partial [Pristionchus mayeri]